MKKNLTNSLLLARLKTLAIKLRANYQIPYQLCKLIRDLKPTDDVKVVSYLKEQCTHMLRVKNYYKMYPMVEKECNSILPKDINGLRKEFYGDSLK